VSANLELACNKRTYQYGVMNEQEDDVKVFSRQRVDDTVHILSDFFARCSRRSILGEGLHYGRLR
jgi:hypothetical protein